MLEHLELRPLDVHLEEDFVLAAEARAQPAGHVDRRHLVRVRVRARARARARTRARVPCPPWAP